jgi:hypothetical protein
MKKETEQYDRCKQNNETKTETASKIKKGLHEPISVK